MQSLYILIMQVDQSQYLNIMAVPDKRKYQDFQGPYNNGTFQTMKLN